MTRFKTCLAAGITGLTMLGAGAFASAAAPDEVPRVAVAYRNLDLSTASGAERLYSRILAAAAQVCARPDTFQLSRLGPSIRCQRDAVDRAVSRVGSPRLAAVYAARAHRAVRAPV